MTDQEEIQNQILQFQQLQQQFESISTSRAKMEHQLLEVEAAYDEVEKLDDKAPVYKSLGTLMVRAKDKVEILKEFQERKETLKIRVESFKRQEKSAEEMLRKLSQDIQEKLNEVRGDQAPPQDA